MSAQVEILSEKNPFNWFHFQKAHIANVQKVPSK